MKFKVGDKVIKADGRRWTSGEKYKKVELADPLVGYKLNRCLGYWKEEELKLFKEECEVKKTFKEVIATIKEGESWESEEKIIRLMNTNDIVITLKDRDRRINSMGFASGTLYHLQRKEYTFEEAFKAYEEGKEIESCEECRFKLIDKDTTLIIDCVGDEMEYSNKKELFSLKEIRGKWYINN